jgi:cytochrome c-type biogenesis protein CcmE
MTREPATPEPAASPSADVARDRRRRRALLVGALAIAAMAFGFLAFSNVGENLVYYWTPTELLAAGDEAGKASVRLAGLVVADSVRTAEDGLTLDFAVTDGKSTVPVRAHTVPPAMFREGIGVVLEGSLLADGHFQTDRLMVKHDNEYRAPGTPDERSVEELVRTLKLEQDT